MTYREETNFFYINFQIIKRYKEFMGKALMDLDLMPAEIDVLTFLINNEGKNITASEISLNRGISKGLVSRAVNLLKDKKIIETVKNPEDGRSVYLKIIDNENKLVNEIKEVNKKFIYRLLQDVDTSDLHLFLKINNKMLNNIKTIE